LAQSGFVTTGDWVTRQSMDDKETSIHWILERSLKDVKYTDDLELRSHSFEHIQEKTRCLEEMAATVGFRINKKR